MSDLVLIPDEQIEVLPPSSKSKDEEGLTVKQRAFCEALLANGGNRTKAAITAGYGRAGAHVTGHRLAKLPQVRKYLAQAAEALIAEAAPQAAETMRKLLKHKSGYVRFEAAKDVLNRNGVGSTTGQGSGVSLNVVIKL
jgi:phage terminase small subunit